MESVEEACLWRPTALRDQGQLGRGRFTLQMRQNPLDDSRIFNASDDLDLPLTALAGLNLVFFIGSILDRCVAPRDNQFDDGAIVRGFLHFSVFL